MVLFSVNRSQGRSSIIKIIRHVCASVGGVLYEIYTIMISDSTNPAQSIQDVNAFWSELKLLLLIILSSSRLQAVQREMAGLLTVASEAAGSCGLLSGQEVVSAIIRGATLNGAVPCLPANAETTFTTLHHFLHALQNKGTIRGCHYLSHLLQYSFGRWCVEGTCTQYTADVMWYFLLVIM